MIDLKERTQTPHTHHTPHAPVTFKEVHQLLLRFDGPLNQKRDAIERQNVLGGEMNQISNETTFPNPDWIQEGTSNFWQQIEQVMWPNENICL